MVFPTPPLPETLAPRFLTIARAASNWKVASAQHVPIPSGSAMTVHSLVCVNCGACIHAPKACPLNLRSPLHIVYGLHVDRCAATMRSAMTLLGDFLRVSFFWNMSVPSALRWCVTAAFSSCIFRAGPLTSTATTMQPCIVQPMRVASASARQTMRCSMDRLVRPKRAIVLFVKVAVCVMYLTSPVSCT